MREEGPNSPTHGQPGILPHRREEAERDDGRVQSHPLLAVLPPHTASSETGWTVRVHGLTDGRQVGRWMYRIMDGCLDRWVDRWTGREGQNEGQTGGHKGHEGRGVQGDGQGVRARGQGRARVEGGRAHLSSESAPYYFN